MELASIEKNDIFDLELEIMKKTIVGFFLVGVTLIGFAFTNNQNAKKATITREEVSGINFQNLSLEDAKKLAKETNKLIFIDVYTSWCGPCKMMAKGPFKEEKVGKIFNEQFINLKIDAEKDADGPFVSRAYSVRAYPTMIFINGEGKLIKTVIGYQNAEALLMHAEMRK